MDAFRSRARAGRLPAVRARNHPASAARWSTISVSARRVSILPAVSAPSDDAGRPRGNASSGRDGMARPDAIFWGEPARARATLARELVGALLVLLILLEAKLSGVAEVKAAGS